MRKPFKKSLSSLPLEGAHGSAGKRKLLLSQNDPVSSQLQAMTKGFLAPKGVFDWHRHEGVDEFFFVTQGKGIINFRDNIIEYSEGDLVYIPAGVEHRIENIDVVENQFFFVRLSK